MTLSVVCLPLLSGSYSVSHKKTEWSPGRFVVVAVVLTLTRIVKSVVTGQAPVTLELRNTPGKTHTTQGGTRIYHS